MLHNNDPVKLEAVNVEVPQSFDTVTTGAAGTGLTINKAALEFTEPTLFVQTARYCLLLSSLVVANVSVALVAPLIFVHVVPFVLTCH